MNIWERLFYGEFAAHERILADLTLEQVTRRLPGQPHSIYAELWQNLLLFPDDHQYDRRWEASERHSEHPRRSAAQWSALVGEVLARQAQVLERTTLPERQATAVEPGMTVADVLRRLAVHNAYHPGKIVALRRVIKLCHIRMTWWASGAKTHSAMWDQWTMAPIPFRVGR